MFIGTILNLVSSFTQYRMEKILPLIAINLKLCKGGFPVIAEITRYHTFTKDIMQVLAAKILIRISIVKIVCECFLR